MTEHDDLYDDYIRLNVERELLIAEGVDETDLLRPLQPIPPDENVNE